MEEDKLLVDREIALFIPSVGRHTDYGKIVTIQFFVILYPIFSSEQSSHLWVSIVVFIVDKILSSVIILALLVLTRTHV